MKPESINLMDFLKDLQKRGMIEIRTTNETINKLWSEKVKKHHKDWEKYNGNKKMD